MSGRYFLAFFSVALGICAGESSNLTGTWKLNVDRSQWGTAHKPLSETLTIDHKEPALTYSGAVMYAGEDTREYGFHGAIDGKAYAMTRSYGTGTVLLHRVDASTFESVFRTNDGASVETARTSVSRDGRILTRKIRVQRPEGVKAWTEVYERQ